MESFRFASLPLFLYFFLAPLKVYGTRVSVVGGRIPSPPATVFNVLNFGAKPDGRTESTKAFQDAWDATCSCSGNSRMLVPKGEFLVGQLHFEGPCKSPFPITFQVKGTVKATIDVSKYEDGEWIKFEAIDGFKLNGGGTFDGQGPAIWGKHSCGGSSSKCGSRAVNIKFFKLKNVKLGHITSLNPKGFHMCINTCENFVAKRIKIVAPGDSPNTDGIHIGHSTNVRIVHSIISTGDDCVSIIDGSTRVTVADVYCGPGHGISVGSLGKNNDEKDVRAILVKNCTLSDTTNGVRIKTWRGSAPSAGENIHFDNIVMNNVQNPIVIDQEYCDKTENCRGNQPSRVKLSNISFRKIRGTSTTKHAVKMRCSSAVPCENVQMFNVNLQYSVNTSRLLPALSECSNIRVNAAGIQFPPPCV